MQQVNRLLKSDVLVPALLLVVVILQVLTIVRGNPSNLEQAQEKRNVTQTRQEAAGLMQQISKLNAMLDQQNVDLHRVLATFDLPKPARDQIQNIEQRLSQSSTWPKSAGEAEHLRKQLEELVKQQLSPGVEEQLLPQLNVVRWGVRCLWLVQQNVDAKDDKAVVLAEEIRSLLAVAPDNAPQELKRYMERQREAFQKKADEYSIQVARNRAKQALAGKGDLLEAAQGLEGLSADGLDKLRSDLRLQMLNRDTGRKVDVLQATLRAAPKLPTDKLRQAGVLKVQDAAASLLLDLEAEQPTRPQAMASVRALIEDSEKQIRQLARLQQTAQEQKLRDYQRWALAQIRHFDSDQGWYYDVTLPWIREQLTSFKDADQPVQDWSLFSTFPSTKELLTEKIGVDLSSIKGASLTPEQQHSLYEAAQARIGWKANIDQEIAYRTTRDGMVLFLLPINVALLDPPVAQLYQKAFQKAWNKLEGRPDQLYVAEQSVSIKRKGLDE